jgi:CelD/BcsL family acetyltransferase involved in cellulose biosynthesis
LLSPVRVELLPLGALSAADGARWRELAAGAVERNPFFEPEFVGPAVRHLGARRHSLLVVRDEHGWAACMPVHRVARFRKLPGPALVSWVHEHCFLGTPLMAPGRIVPSLAGSARPRRRGTRLQLLALEAGDQTLAMKCNLVAGDAIYCFKIAYDEALSRFSPWIQLELANIDLFHATTGVAWTDSCAAPDNQMINRLWRGRRSVATELVPGRRAVGSLSSVALRAALQARRQWRRHR